MKCAGLEREHSFVNERFTAIDELGRARTVLDGARRNFGHCGFVGLREIGCVRVHLEALLGEPCDSATRVEAARKRNAETSAFGWKGSVDMAHSEARLSTPERRSVTRQAWPQTLSAETIGAWRCRFEKLR